MNFLRTNWLALIAIGLFVYLIFSRGQGCNAPDAKPRIDTVTVRTIEQIPQPPVYVPTYVPVQTGSQAPVVIPPQYQPNTADMKVLLKQYDELVKLYLAKNTFVDKISLADSTGKEVGVVNIKDEISENTVKERDVDYQLSFPKETITQTITIREPYVPRTQVYLGGGITGTPAQIVNGFKAEGLIKNKKDHVYGIEAGAMSIGGKLAPVYGIKALWKIKLK